MIKGVYSTVKHFCGIQWLPGMIGTHGEDLVLIGNAEFCLYYHMICKTVYTASILDLCNEGFMLSMGPTRKQLFNTPRAECNHLSMSGSVTKREKITREQSPSQASQGQGKETVVSESPIEDSNSRLKSHQ